MTEHTRTTTHRSGPKCKRQVFTLLSRFIWCYRKRNCRGSEFWWALWNRKKVQADRWSAGNCSGRCSFRVRPVEGGQGRGVSEAPEVYPCQPFRCCWRGKDSGPRLPEPPLHEHPTLAPAIKGEEPKPGWAQASRTDRLMTAAVVGEDRESRHPPPPPGVCFVSVLLCRA